MQIEELEKRLGGVWSATPTPFDEEMQVDEESVARMVEHHLRLGVKGLFLAGTCGEGPWLTDGQRSKLIRAAVAASGGRLAIAVQVTDNSAPRVLDNMEAARQAGADLAIIAPPYILMNATAENVTAHFVEAIRQSPLPVGIYDRGKLNSVTITNESLATIYAEEKVITIKDSSADPERREIGLEARRKRPALRLLNGNEFRCAEYMRAGYDGLLLGGGILHGHLANQLIAAVSAGNIDQAEEIEARMIRIMYAVYGGPQLECRLSGLKYTMMKLGIFSTDKAILKIPLTDGCRAAIEDVIRTDGEVLLP